LGRNAIGNTSSPTRVTINVTWITSTTIR
jgi:hypothetical protein